MAPDFHHQLLRPDPETWADAGQIARESHEAWLAGELAALKRAGSARARRRRRGILAGRLALAAVVLIHLAVQLWGRP